jgi:hypothetical protein
MHFLSTTKQTITALQDTNKRNRKKSIENVKDKGYEAEKLHFVPDVCVWRVG